MRSICILVIYICLWACHATFGMNEYFTKHHVQVPLKPIKQNPPTISKDVYLHIPANKIQESKDESLKEYVAEAVLEMRAALCACLGLMFANDKGWFYPEFEEGLQYINAELFALLQMKQTYFVYSKEDRQLVLRWDLGLCKNGWAFDKIIEIKYLPEHKRKGTCSDLMVRYWHHKNNIHGQVPLQTLRSHYARAGKQTKLNVLKHAVLSKSLSPEEIEKMQQDDVVAMAQYYVSNPDNVKDAIKA